MLPPNTLATMSVSLIRAVVLATFLALLLAGCKFTLSQVSAATVEQYQPGRPLQAKELTPNQVRALSAWFSQHDSGWSSSVVSYVPMLVVRAKHADGDTSVINIMSYTVVVYNRSGQYQQQFSQNELAAIQHILEVQ